jgi:hypothetical protein
VPDVSGVTGNDYEIGNRPKRSKSFRESMPKETNLVDNMHTGPQAVEFASNKALSGGRDLSRPLVPGSTARLGAGLRRKGRRGRTR